MARPRITQFANDLGISRNAAKKLVDKGRGRSDGGSNVLDSYSPELKKRMRRFDDAERIFLEDTEIGTKMDKSKSKPKSKRKMFDEYFKKNGTTHPNDPRSKRDHPMNREGSPLKTETKDIVEAKEGKYVRGMGKASMCSPREVKVK